MIDGIVEMIDDVADSLLNRQRETIVNRLLYISGLDIVVEYCDLRDLSPPALANLQRLFHHGRLADIEYLSILSIDQVAAHSSAERDIPNSPDAASGRADFARAMRGSLSSRSPADWSSSVVTTRLGDCGKKSPTFP